VSQSSEEAIQEQMNLGLSLTSVLKKPPTCLFLFDSFQAEILPV